jgi:hypothetical protein
MKPIPRDKIEKSFVEKGFVKEEGRDHRYWYFFYKGEKTRIKTKISIGSGYKDYGINLLKMIKTQLYLDSLKELDDLLRCPMDGNQYSELMLIKGIVIPKRV